MGSAAAETKNVMGHFDVTLAASSRSCLEKVGKREEDDDDDDESIVGHFNPPQMYAEGNPVS